MFFVLSRAFHHKPSNSPSFLILKTDAAEEELVDVDGADDVATSSTLSSPEQFVTPATLVAE